MVLASAGLVSAGQTARRTCPKLAVAIMATIGLFPIATPVRAQCPPGCCPLLSRADVEHALRAPAGDGKIRVDTEYLTSCTFAIAGGGSVSILLRRNVSKEWVAEQRQRMSSAGNFRAIAGEDSVFLLDMHQAGAVLCVFRGQAYLVVSMIRSGGSDIVLPAALEMARRALARL